MRLFLAITLPGEIRKKIFEAGEVLKKYGRLKYVEEENIHITLKFLGDAEPGPIIESLKLIEFKPFEVSMKGLGAFPDLRNPRVFWAGCEKGFKEIITLHDKIENSLDFSKDKDFHPHVTLARTKFLKDKKSLMEYFESAKSIEFGEFEVASFDFMKSELTREGPVYEIIKSFS